MTFLVRLLILTSWLLAANPALAQPLYGERTMKFINQPAAKVKIPELAKVKVGIENPLRQGLLLGMVRGNEEIELAMLGNEEVISLELPPGNYFVGDEHGNRFAVPIDKHQDIQITPIVKMKSDEDWAWIPPGPTIVGDQLGIGAMDERPIRVITFPAFWLQKTEVTNQQFAKFLNAQKEINPKWIDLQSRKCLIEKTELDGKTHFKPHNDREKEAATMPVVMVSHMGATAYCDWLTRVNGVKHRLPTEEEWEIAARGPLSLVYAYGNVYDQTAANQESGRLKPVKSYNANGFGLYDMTGNVFEWMLNKYDPGNSELKMNQALRGGSFVLDGMYLRNSFRMRQSPSVMTDDIGFRVLREEKK